MNTRTWMLSGLVLTFPALGWSADPPPPAQPGKPTFSLQSAQVQQSIRTAARMQNEIKPATNAAQSPDALQPMMLGGQTTIPFRAPLRPHYVKCDNVDCVAYTADDVALYTVPRAQYYGDGTDGGNKLDGWLACQSRDNLLSTFERYDKCRGITTGLPLSFDNTTIAAPGLRF